MSTRSNSKRSKTDTKFATNPEFVQLLLQTPVDRFFDKDAIIFIAERTNKVLDVWKGLAEKNFLSVPVLQKTEHLYYGSLDLVDIVRHVVHRFKDEKIRGDENFWKQVSEAKAFEEVTVNDILQFPRTWRNQFHPVRKGYSLLFACELLAREHSLHRVPIVDESRHLINLITQSKVVEFIHSQAALVGDKLNKPLEDCLGVFHTVLSVSENVPAIDAFDKMVTEDVSGLAVLDEENKLVENISLRDLKAVSTSLIHFWRFYGSTKLFLHNVRGDNRPSEVICVTAKNTLGEALALMAEHHIHRVYIVDAKETMAVKGVVSLKDVLYEILQ